MQRLSGKKNIEKGDWVEYMGEQFRARDIRNDYEIIAYLSEKLLDTNIDTIIHEDKEYLLM